MGGCGASRHENTQQAESKLGPYASEKTTLPFGKALLGDAALLEGKTRPEDKKPFWEGTLAKVVSDRPDQRIRFRKAVKCCKGCVRGGRMNEKQFCLVWGTAQAT